MRQQNLHHQMQNDGLLMQAREGWRTPGLSTFRDLPLGGAGRALRGRLSRLKYGPLVLSLEQGTPGPRQQPQFRPKCPNRASPRFPRTEAEPPPHESSTPRTAGWPPYGPQAHQGAAHAPMHHPFPPLDAALLTKGVVIPASTPPPPPTLREPAALRRSFVLESDNGKEKSPVQTTPLPLSSSSKSSENWHVANAENLLLRRLQHH